MSREYTIPKSDDGSLVYRIDVDECFIQILADLPETFRTSGQGGSFSKRLISFADINDMLDRYSGEQITGARIVAILSGSINDGTMLVAILKHLSILDEDSFFIEYLDTDIILP